MMNFQKKGFGEILINIFRYLMEFLIPLSYALISHEKKYRSKATIEP